MKTVEFQASLREDHSLPVPDEVAAQVPPDRPVHVILVLADPNESDDAAWARLAADQFLSGYDESDSIYDDVPTG